MKKVLAVAILFVFVLGVVSAFAEEAASGAAAPAASGDSVFQAAADNIANWDKSAPEAEKESLRGNKAELEKRNDTRNPMM